MLTVLLFRCLMTLAVSLPTFEPFWPESEQWNYEQECKIGDRAFTGVRIMDVRLLEFPSTQRLATSLVLLGCELGQPRFNVTLNPSDVFNTSIDVGRLPNSAESTTLRLSRRPNYVKLGHQKLRYISGTIVGGVYAQGGYGNWLPVSPLIGDKWSLTATHYGFRNKTAEITIVTSLLRSPEPLDKTYPKNDDWGEYMSPIERCS